MFTRLNSLEVFPEILEIRDIYGVPTSPRSADLPSGEAEAEGGRVATSLCFIVATQGGTTVGETLAKLIVVSE